MDKNVYIYLIYSDTVSNTKLYRIKRKTIRKTIFWVSISRVMLLRSFQNPLATLGHLFARRPTGCWRLRRSWIQYLQHKTCSTGCFGCHYLGLFWFYRCSCPKWNGQMCFFTLSGQKQHSLSWALAQMWFRIFHRTNPCLFLLNIVKVWPAWPSMRSVWASALDKARPNNPSSAMNSRRGA
jgi:hypothetical protein